MFPRVQLHKNQWADTELLQALVHFYLLTQSDQSSLCSFALLTAVKQPKYLLLFFYLNLELDGKVKWLMANSKKKNPKSSLSILKLEYFANIFVIALGEEKRKTNQSLPRNPNIIFLYIHIYTYLFFFF